MTTQPDPDVIVAAWLADGPTDLPEDLERSISIATRAMPQSRGRVTRLARRIDMTRFQTLGLVAAVAIAAVVGLVALSTFRGDGSGVGGQPSASPTPAPTTATTPAPPSAAPPCPTIMR